MEEVSSAGFCTEDTRVLVVSANESFSTGLETMLKECKYNKVRTCKSANDAFLLLRGEKERFEIVMIDVDKLHNGFELFPLAHKFDIPAIMWSEDGEPSKVMKGIQLGASHFLQKPILRVNVRHIWQHVVVRRPKIINYGAEFDGHGMIAAAAGNKREYEEYEGLKAPLASPKKPKRVIWTTELHQSFLHALNTLNQKGQKAGPKRILELMKVPGLTRENVASHLQKHRSRNNGVSDSIIYPCPPPPQDIDDDIDENIVCRSMILQQQQQYQVINENQQQQPMPMPRRQNMQAPPPQRPFVTYGDSHFYNFPPSPQPPAAPLRSWPPSYHPYIKT